MLSIFFIFLLLNLPRHVVIAYFSLVQLGRLRYVVDRADIEPHSKLL